MKSRKILITLVFIYNLIGLMSLLGLYSNDPLYWNGSIIILIITFPVTIFSFGYRFFYPEPLYPIFIIQFIVLLISIYISNFIINKK